MPEKEKENEILIVINDIEVKIQQLNKILPYSVIQALDDKIRMTIRGVLHQIKGIKFVKQNNEDLRGIIKNFLQLIDNAPSEEIINTLVSLENKLKKLNNKIYNKRFKCKKRSKK